MPSTVLPTIHPDQIDDLIYYARTSDLPSLKSEIASLSSTHICNPASILEAANDKDSGCSLLHYAGANGDEGTYRPSPQPLPTQYHRPCPSHPRPETSTDIPLQPKPEILTHLLSHLPKSHPLLNQPNTLGNTPLHWTALNHHLPCIQALVAAGADPAIVNAAGHDAVFEAERATMGVDDEKEKEKAERGRKCVEWLLGCMEGVTLEKGVKGGGGEGEVERAAEGGEVEMGEGS